MPLSFIPQIVYLTGRRMLHETKRTEGDENTASKQIEAIRWLETCGNAEMDSCLQTAALSTADPSLHQREGSRAFIIQGAPCCFL